MPNGHILLEEKNSLSLLIVQIMCDSVLPAVIFKVLLRGHNVQLRIKGSVKLLAPLVGAWR